MLNNFHSCSQPDSALAWNNFWLTDRLKEPKPHPHADDLTTSNSKLEPNNLTVVKTERTFSQVSSFSLPNGAEIWKYRLFPTNGRLRSCIRLKIIFPTQRKLYKTSSHKMQGHHTCHLETDLKNKMFFCLVPTWRCILNWILTAHPLDTTQSLRLTKVQRCPPLRHKLWTLKYLNIWYCMVQHVNEVVNFIIFVH